MSRSILLIGVVAAVWAIGITLADKTPSQASNVKQRGDQVITSEDDLVAPSIETEVFTSKENQLDTKKNEVDDKIASRKPSYKKPVSKYSQLKKLSGKGKPRYRDHPPHHPKNKQIRPPLPPPRPTHLHKPHKVNPKQIRPNLRQAPKKAPEPAQRRDSSYGAPPAPQPKVIIKQAGPSKQYAWVGHQHYHNPGHDVPGHVFAAANLPKWTLMGSNIFQANLLYPGDPKAPAKETYKPPAPVKAAPPPAPVQPAAPSYGPPQTTPAPAPAAPAYNPPEPAPLGYDEPAPVYNNPFVAQPKPTTAAPPPVYQQPASTPAVYVGQPSYVPSYPSIQYVPAQPTPAAPTPAPTTPAPAPPVYNRPQPNYYNQFASSFPTYSALPQQPSQAPILPAVSSPAGNVYNVPIKVEETPSYEGSGGEGGDEVFYIFYEDKKPEASYEAPTYQSPPSQNDISSYIVEDVQASKAPPPQPSAPAPANAYQFNAPNPKDIHTVYVPFENAVNVPATYDVSVASSFGYQSGEPSNQAGTGAVPPSYSGFPNFPVTGSSSSPPSYDSSISSYDAPILDDNSYTAKNPNNLNQLFYSDTFGIKKEQKHKEEQNVPRPVRNLRLLPPVRQLADPVVSPSNSLRAQVAAPEGQTRTYSWKLVPGKAENVPYGTRLGPRKPYDITVPGL